MATPESKALPESDSDALLFAQFLLSPAAEGKLEVELLPRGEIRLRVGDLCCTTTREKWKQAVADAERIPEYILRAVSPEFHWYRLEYPSGLPHVDNDIAGMIRSLGEEPAPNQVAKIPDVERDELMLSLAQTLNRAVYHEKRFEEIFSEAEKRKRLVGATVGSDFITQYLHYEATSLFVAARGAVDQVIYLAARRAGCSERKANEWEASTAIREKDPNKRRKSGYDVDEVRLLQGPHFAWYEKLNLYRNVLTHQGWRYASCGGYYEKGVSLPEASHPTNNSLLVPDADSAKGRLRPHRWTYKEGNRLEVLIREIADGLMKFLTDVGTLAWGGTVEEIRGTVPVEQQPNMLIVRPHPMFIPEAPHCYIPMFTSAEKAEAFFEGAFLKKADSPPFEARPLELDDHHGGPGFCFPFPNGHAIVKFMSQQMSNFSGIVKLVIDPTLAPNA